MNKKNTTDYYDYKSLILEIIKLLIKGFFFASAFMFWFMLLGLYKDFPEEVVNAKTTIAAYFSIFVMIYVGFVIVFKGFSFKKKNEKHTWNNPV